MANEETRDMTEQEMPTETPENATETPVSKPAESPAAPVQEAVAEAPATTANVPRSGNRVARGLEVDRRRSNIDRLMRERERAEAKARSEAILGKLSALQQARVSHRIMEGVIGAVRMVPLDETASEDQMAVMLSVMVNQIRVDIPFHEFFRDPPIDMSTVDLTSAYGRRMYIQRQRQMAEKMYGAKIPFVITNVIVDKEPTESKVSGSRREALRMMERRNFYPSQGREPLFQEGQFVNANIVSVGVHNIYLNVGGVDATIPLRDMTYRYVQNLVDYYKVSDGTVKVMIRNISKDENDNIKLTLSAKAVELYDAHRRQEMGVVKVGDSMLGTITSIRLSSIHPNQIVINAYIPFLDMPAIIRGLDPSTLTSMPQAGDTIRISVTGWNNHGFVLANCRGFHDSVTLLNRA